MSFGDDSTADVFLTLSSDEALGPLKLHSTVLSRSGIFKAQLSERRASHGKPSKIRLTGSKDPVMYIKFLELLYAPEKRHLCSLEEALGILEVAAQLLCEEVISYCMNYVEAIPWTCEDEEAVRLCISSLNLRPSPDLALKLESGNFCAADELQNMLHHLILSADRTDIHKHVADIMLSNVQDPAFAVVTQNLLVQDLHRTIQNLKRGLDPKTDCFDDKHDGPPYYIYSRYGKLKWLLDQFQKLNITGVAIKILAEDNELAELIFEKGCRHLSTGWFLNYLGRLYGDLCDGKVVLPRAVRMALVTSWFRFRTSEHLDRDRNWLAYMVKSLPMRDQSKIFNLWIHSGPSSKDPLIEVFLSWCHKIEVTTI